MKRLERTLLYSTVLKAFPGRSEVIYHNVLQANISHEVGLYHLAAVKFAYAFFPTERYALQYTDVHNVLDQDPQSQNKLEALYKMCMKELLSAERTYNVVKRHLALAPNLFDDFRRIALDHKCPQFSEELVSMIDATCPEEQDRQILRMFLTFNASMRVTNFFKTETPGAFSSDSIQKWF